MTRTISDATKEAIHSQETGEAFLILLTIDHTDLAAPIRVANNSEDIVSNGDTFLAFPFLLELPKDSDSLAPEATLTIDNVDRQIIAAVRSISSAPSVKIEVIRSGDPDTIEVSYDGMELRDVVYNAFQVSGKIVMQRFDAEPYPAGRMTPVDFPGLF